MKDYGIKSPKQDAFSSFLRILNNNGSDLLEWYREAYGVVRPNEQLYLRFVAITGLRKSEAITSFNMIHQLYGQKSLNDYYNEELNALEHYKFKEYFLRGSKNAYISFIRKSLILEIASRRPPTYPQILKQLKRKGLKCRINELRDYYGTFMVRHGLIREEVDLLQGRIPPSIFIRHYWSPSFKELRDRTLTAISELERSFDNIETDRLAHN
jgi:intergrase/recombinase